MTPSAGAAEGERRTVSQRERSASLSNVGGEVFSAARDDAPMEEIHGSEINSLHKPCSISRQPPHSTRRHAERPITSSLAVFVQNS